MSILETVNGFGFSRFLGLFWPILYSLFSLAILPIALIFTGCQKQPLPLGKEQVLRVNIGEDPQTLDPRKARDLTSVTLVRMFFEGLTRISKEADIELALAESVDISEDGLQYCFHLRKSFWSNGEPVTSFDFADSWRSMLDPEFPTDMAYQLYVIKNGRKARLGEASLDKVGLQTPDAYTLIVDLEQPIPYFLQLISMVSFYPVPYKAITSNPNWILDPATYICNGPFILKSWKHGDQITAIKNEWYWEAKETALTQIDLLMMSRDTELQMFEEGKLDWAGSPLSTIPTDAIVNLKTSDQFHVNPFAATYFFRLNTKEQLQGKKNPLNSPSFRKALALSIDRQGITEHVLQGGQSPAKGLVPPELGLSEKGYFQDGYQEEARSLLTDSLLELDQTLDTLDPVKISYSSNERNTLIAQAIQKQWENNLKLKVELEAIEPKTFYQRIAQKEYQIAAGSWTADFADPINFLEVFKYKEGSTNNTNWENGKYIDLLNRSALCRSEEERKVLLREAEQILMDQMPLIPIFHFTMNYLQRNGVEEIALSPLGQIDFRWAHLDPAQELVSQ